MGCGLTREGVREAAGGLARCGRGPMPIRPALVHMVIPYQFPMPVASATTAHENVACRLGDVHVGRAHLRDPTVGTGSSPANRRWSVLHRRVPAPHRGAGRRWGLGKARPYYSSSPTPIGDPGGSWRVHSCIGPGRNRRGYPPLVPRPTAGTGSSPANRRRSAPHHGYRPASGCGETTEEVRENEVGGKSIRAGQVIFVPIFHACCHRRHRS